VRIRHLYISQVYVTIEPCAAGRGQSLTGALGDSGSYVASRRRGGRRRPLPEFEWDEHNEEKLLRRHNVSALEAEQSFANPHTRRRVEDAMLMLGVTDSGRMLFLAYQQKTGGLVRVYTAREMTDRERRTYRRHAR
jgi:uncharacterized DUF497 family protein